MTLEAQLLLLFSLSNDLAPRPFVMYLYKVFCNCCNRLPKLGGLRQWKFILSQVVESRSPNLVSLGWNQGVGRATFPLQVLENAYFASAYFWWLSAVLGLWLLLSNLCLCLHITLFKQRREPQGPNDKSRVYFITTVYTQGFLGKSCFWIPLFIIHGYHCQASTFCLHPHFWFHMLISPLFCQDSKLAS